MSFLPLFDAHYETFIHYSENNSHVGRFNSIDIFSHLNNNKRKKVDKKEEKIDKNI